MQEFFEEIVSIEFDIPDEYNTRDWISLYNFQKYYIFSTVERIMELVEVKQEHDWMSYEESAWKGQSKCFLRLFYFIFKKDFFG